MIIVIDGYNLLKAVFPGKERHHRERDQLIRHLGYYKAKKGHEIVLVFDGGHEKHAVRTITKGVVVIFPGYKRSADDWIADFIERKKDHEMLLVSRDNDLIKRTSTYNVDPIGVEAFYALVLDTILDDVEAALPSQKSGTKAYEREDEMPEIDSEALDILMAQADVSSYINEDDEPRDRRKKGKTKGKNEKRLARKIKKL